VALAKGVRIYEGTRVIAFDRERPLAIRTDGGLLAAEKLVLANGAWAAALPEMWMSFVNVSSDIIATEPIPERLGEIGWTGGEGIADSQLMVDYYRTTRDGRIAFGKGVAGVGYGGRVGGHFDRSPRRAAAAAADFRQAYPALSDVRVEHDWSGPVDRTPTSVPIFGHLGGREHIVYGLGWSGNGVGPSVVGGKILASLALGLDDEWSSSSLVDRKRDLFPPEPVRFLGAQIVRQAVVHKERAEMDGKQPNGLATRLAGLAPAGIEDKEASRIPVGSPVSPAFSAGGHGD
jgi:glycine/D-amino acid oxidase-like deaminating enzyme